MSVKALDTIESVTAPPVGASLKLRLLEDYSDDYRLVDGSIFHEDDRPETWLLHYYIGLGKAALQLVDQNTNGHKWPLPNKTTVKSSSINRTVLTTERRDLSADQQTMVMFPGLMELEVGSAYRLHVSMAKTFPERKIISLMTPGISFTGSSMPINDGISRSLFKTAEENLPIVNEFAGGESIKLVGTSLGSAMAVHLAVLNQKHNTLNVSGIDLLSPAVGVRHVNYDQLNMPALPDATDTESVNEITRDFYKHMVVEGFRMCLKHPEGSGEVTVASLSYMLHPHKLINRAATIAGNLKAVQYGIENEELIKLAQQIPFHVLGGADCPVVQATLPSLVALKKQAPNTKLWLVKDVGHAMTINSEAVSALIKQMEN